MLWTPDNPNGRTPGNGSAAAAPGGVQIRCPRCQTPFVADIINVVDVSQHPELKAALLGGYLNRAQCPGCGAISVVNVPLVYHDPDKELLLVLLPSELNLSAEQQQRLIGRLVQAIMSYVPPEKRKGYFLRPQTILSMQRLVETILEADGVTPEMLAEQRRRLQLLEDLLRAKDDPAQLKALLEAHRSEIDYTFMATLTAVAQEAGLTGDPSGGEQILALRDQLLQDPDLAARMPQRLSPDMTIDQVLEKVEPLAGDADALAAMVLVNRPFFDYAFFQALTAKIDQAKASGDAARAERLADLRALILEEASRQDRALQAAQQEDLELIEELVNSPDPQAALREQLGRVDTMFLNSLSTAIESARRQGDVARSARLDGLRQAILEILAEGMPPEMRLVNRLLGLESAQERQAALAQSAELLSDDLESLLQDLIAEMQEQGRADAAARLGTILAEVQQARAANPASKP